MESEEIKKYLFIVYSVISTDTILEKLYEHMPDNSQYNKMNIGDMVFISFYSEDDINDIKDSIYFLFEKSPLFFIFDISEELRGDTFELWFERVEKNILLDFEPLIDETKIIDVNGIIELINKNGFDTLTEKQIKILEEYSKEDNNENK